MLIIDRFEGRFAVLDTGEGMINILRAEIPKGAREGDVLKLTIDTDNTAARKKRIDSMMNELFKV